MDDNHKNAYRFLLYEATHDTRTLLWRMYWHRRMLSPCIRRWLFAEARCIGALADWLHNPALFSSLDFEGFDEDRFWQEYEHFAEKYGWIGPERYQDFFEGRLEE